ncbi:hydrogenase maturation nickel metallochaperone HypA [Desulfovibrio sp. OttesenSCG-928-A18]|nr:hydrogenase maturation nickel metallochaperone HypA [Desulfovibrio sp. OttesenSCG-928-A18]
MHEMSLVISLLDIVRQEMRKHGARTLRVVRLRAGALANVVPEALEMAFEVQTQDGDMQGAQLELVEEPLRLACGACGHEFGPEPVRASLFSPCPACGEDIGHKVLSGKELYIDSIEVD